MSTAGLNILDMGEIGAKHIAMVTLELMTSIHSLIGTNRDEEIGNHMTLDVIHIANVMQNKISFNTINDPQEAIETKTETDTADANY